MAGRRLVAEDATKVGAFFLGVLVDGLLFSGFNVGVDPPADALVSTAELTAVLPDEAASLSRESSSASDSFGDTNRVLGRGPDAEGPLAFFRIGCGGGGLEDEAGTGFGESPSLDDALPPSLTRALGCWPVGVPTMRALSKSYAS